MNKHILVLIVLLSTCLMVKGQYDYEYETTIVQTPTGVNVDALSFRYWIYNDFDANDIAIENFNWTNGYNCEIIENSTKYYNCHGYVWYNVEGNMSQVNLRWINNIDYYGNPTYNVQKYYSSSYSGGNPSYRQVSTNNRAYLKVSYFPRDHSALTTSNSSYFISKWSWGPLVRHTPAQCPFYPNAIIKYYELIPPVISGSSDAICNGSQQTLSETGFTHIDLNYNWNISNLLSEVSGNGTSQYTVQGTSQNGTATVSLTVTTPSGATATANKAVWVGTPTPEIIDIINIGPYYPGGNQICTNRPNDGIINWNSFGGILEYGWQAGNWQVVQHPMDPFPDIPKQNVQLTAPYYGYDNPVSVTVRARNQCGWGNYLAPAIILNGVSCGGYYLVASPNPAGSYVELTLIPEAEVSEVAGKTKIEQAGSNNGFGSYQIQLWSEQGGLLKTVQSDQLKLNLPVRDLPEGKYFLHLLKDGKTYKQQLLIQR